MANVAITDECRHKLAFITLPDEYLRDCIERLVDEEIKRKGIKVTA